MRPGAITPQPGNHGVLSQLDLDRFGQEGDDARSLRAQLAYWEGDTEKALRWADAYTTPVPDRLLTWLQDPHLAKAQLLLARGTVDDVQAALDILAALLEIAQRTFSVRSQIEILALRALAHALQGKAAASAAALQQAVELARPGGICPGFRRPRIADADHVAAPCPTWRPCGAWPSR